MLIIVYIYHTLIDVAREVRAPGKNNLFNLLNKAASDEIAASSV